MKDAVAVQMLAALAQEHRIKIFRGLVCEGASGLTSTQIADWAEISPANASFHLKELARAHLVVRTRQGRYMRYAVHVDGMRQLLTYLTQDCCEGRPELCGGDIKKMSRVCSGD